ncbi:DUF488 domain-containing protein [Deinococcus ruber]|uniref:DUF488 domain-containing protein n=1 Tax=Deinococcus ruber TaxID=1848197 RepID=UPI00166A020B|nr:DUF488 domain-containing protein [Deinococcus ruber]
MSTTSPGPGAVQNFPAGVTLYTIGYEGVALDALIGTLKQAGVRLLVDTRERAQSRRPGFSKTALSSALAQGGVGYLHLRALGTPPAVRKDYKMTHDFASLKRGYLAHLATQGETLEELGRLAARETVALLCYEADPADCHRSLIAARLRELGMVNEVRDLHVGREL